jgi:hypothetical protein
MNVQQNFSDPTSDNLKIQVIHHLRRAVPRPKEMLFTIKSFISETGRSHRHVQKGLQEYLYINYHGISFSPCPHSIRVFSCENSINHRRGP